jgi:hypothetical protein
MYPHYSEPKKLNINFSGVPFPRFYHDLMQREVWIGIDFCEGDGMKEMRD